LHAQGRGVGPPSPFHTYLHTRSGDFHEKNFGVVAGSDGCEMRGLAVDEVGQATVDFSGGLATDYSVGSRRARGIALAILGCTIPSSTTQAIAASHLMCRLYSGNRADLHSEIAHVPSSCTPRPALPLLVAILSVIEEGTTTPIGVLSLLTPV